MITSRIKIMRKTKTGGILTNAAGGENANHGLIVGMARGEHGGETRDFFLAAADGAGLFKLPAVAHDLERAFAVDFFLQPPQRTIHRFAFFQFDLCHYTHFLPGAGTTCLGQIPA